MKLKVEYIVLAILFVGMAVFGFSVLNYNSETIEVNSEAVKSNVSNEKIGWGLKRAKDHLQPDLGKKNLDLINKYNGIAMGNSEKKYLYLTFDEGYEAGYTDKILDTLKANNVTATFFVTAHYINTASDMVTKMIENGNIVGNHTVNHYSMPTIDDDKLKKEVMDLHTTVCEKYNYEMKYIRPPKGEYSERTLLMCNNLGYKTVMWSLAYDDWDEKHQKGEEYAKEKIIGNLHPGAVILLHGNSINNCNVLDTVIKEAKNMGYEFRSLDNFER